MIPTTLTKSGHYCQTKTTLERTMQFLTYTISDNEYSFTRLVTMTIKFDAVE